MSHPNARLTPKARLDLVMEVEVGWTRAEAARRFRVSRATAAKWVRRYRDEGEAGLRDRSAPPPRDRVARGHVAMHGSTPDEAAHIARERGKSLGVALVRHIPTEERA